MFSWPTGLACHTARKFLVPRLRPFALKPPALAAARWRTHFAGARGAEGYDCVKTSKDHSRPVIVNKISSLLVIWRWEGARRESQRDRKWGGEGNATAAKAYAILNIAACCAIAPKTKHLASVLGQNAPPFQKETCADMAAGDVLPEGTVGQGRRPRLGKPAASRSGEGAPAQVVDGQGNGALERPARSDAALAGRA